MAKLKKESDDSDVKQVAAKDDAAQPTLVPRPHPLVFISHDSRDADLAEAFDNLLTDASGGVVQTFRSSDQTGRTGIDYGEDWFSKITRTLADASDVVALLTPNSVDRPWILFESGYAVGQKGTKVFGIAIGVPFAKATSGPFARFQNCEAKETALTAVVLELIRRNPNARPRDEAVRRQVAAFLVAIDAALKNRPKSVPATEEVDATAAAKLFEEVKVMFRDLPSRVEGHLRERGMAKRKRHPRAMVLEELFHIVRVEAGDDLAAAWLFIGALLREDFPWLSEAALALHRAHASRDAKIIEQSQDMLLKLIRLVRHSRVLRPANDEDTMMSLHHLPSALEHFGLIQPVVRRKRAKAAGPKENAPAET